MPLLFISVKMFHAARACHVMQVFDGSKKHGCLFNCMGKMCRATKLQFSTGGFCCAGRKKGQETVVKIKRLFLFLNL